MVSLPAVLGTLGCQLGLLAKEKTLQGERRKRKGKKSKEEEGAKGRQRKALEKKDHGCKKEKGTNMAPQLVAQSPL